MSDSGVVSGVAPADPRTSYGALELIAGTGLITDDGVNGWKASFEGGPATAAELSRPHFAMADATGNIYVADKDAHAIRKIAPDGVISTVAGVNEAGDDGDEPGLGRERHLASPNGLFVKPDGTVYILDLDNQKVRRLAPSGELTTLFHAPGAMSVGRGLWVSAGEDEAYYSSGARLMRWQRDGGLSERLGGFQSLGNIAMDDARRLWVTDRSAGRVFRLESAEKATLVIGGTGAASEGARGADVTLPGVRAVWPDGHGGLLLGTHEGSGVWWLDGQGFLHELYSEPEVKEVRGLTVTLGGDLLLVDHDGGFVKRARPPHE